MKPVYQLIRSLFVFKASCRRHRTNDNLPGYFIATKVLATAALKERKNESAKSSQSDSTDWYLSQDILMNYIALIVLLAPNQGGRLHQPTGLETLENRVREEEIERRNAGLKIALLIFCSRLAEKIRQPLENSGLLCE